MPRLSDNYYQRKCYFERNQVPTQTVMKNKMTPALANVYFKSMTPKLKVLAGLEPPMKGGGNDWYVPPHEILAGRTVMKPVKNEHLSKLGFNGIDFFGERLVKDHRREMEEEKRRILEANDDSWKQRIELTCCRLWDDSSREAAKQNTSKIQQAFHEFTDIYKTSINKIETMLFDAAMKEIERNKENTHLKMKLRYEKFLKHQATTLYNQYENILGKEKQRQKNEFIQNIDRGRNAIANQLHDIKLDKHMAVEKLRLFLECQNLACQTYVALKEREECKKEMDASEHEHRKKMNKLSEEITIKEIEIKFARERERKRQEFIKIWKKKVCHVVKRFQDFVGYCLNLLPEHADFFLNMETLMLLQLSEALENPSVESIFVSEKESYKGPTPKPHPFYVFCDKGFKPKLDDTLCPKHCTSSASQLPVVVVNDRFIYAACDNLEVFPETVKDFIEGKRGNEKDFTDDHDYTFDIPVKCTSSQQLLELKLESSIMQILQKELPNVNNVPIDCCYCKIPYCFCSPLHASQIKIDRPVQQSRVEIPKKIPSGEKIVSRETELEHLREPKWDSYMKYIEPQKCKCGKRAKKHLEEHLPAYMRKMSKYEAPELPTYETCSLETLKILVKEARGKKTPPPTPEKAPSKTRTIGTQYTDEEYENLCTCFSDEELDKILQRLATEAKYYAPPKMKVVDGSVSPSFIDKPTTTFATERAVSLRRLINDSPELEEIFRKEDCKF
ncbi:unnamed protein product [Colias eurytheme]|nr:unnamed protein product [Colias eurytheme]